MFGIAVDHRHVIDVEANSRALQVGVLQKKEKRNSKSKKPSRDPHYLQDVVRETEALKSFRRFSIMPARLGQNVLRRLRQGQEFSRKGYDQMFKNQLGKQDNHQ